MQLLDEQAVLVDEVDGPGRTTAPRTAPLMDDRAGVGLVSGRRWSGMTVAEADRHAERDRCGMAFSLSACVCVPASPGGVQVVALCVPSFPGAVLGALVEGALLE